MENISEKILSYLQGTLNELEESELFTALSYNGDFRDEFRNFAAIDKSLRSSSTSFIPPQEITNNIFKELGVRPQLTNQDIALIPEFSTPFYKSRLFAVLVAGITSAIVTSLLLLNINNPAHTKTISDKAFPKDDAGTLINTENEPVHSFRINNSSEKNYSKSLIMLNKNLTKHILKRNTILTENNHNSDIDHFYPRTPALENFLNYSTKYRSNNPLMNKPKMLNPRIKHLELIKIPDMEMDSKNSDIEENSNTGFSMEIKNSAAWNIPQETIYPGEIAKFNNLDINCFYSFGESISIGIGIKQETFYVKYTGNDNLGRNVITEQQPNLTTYNLIYRQSLFDFIKLGIFSEFSIGGCGYGNILRGGFGGNYPISKNLSSIMILEMSLMGYTHQNNYNTSYKIGIYYGLNYKF